MSQQFFVLHKNGRNCLGGNSLYKTAERQLCVWRDEARAEAHAEKFNKTMNENWRVRLADSEDFGAVELDRGKHKRYMPLYVVMDETKEKQMAKKVTSVGLLVELFEDYETRRFAISSRASSENEFLVEVSQAMSSSAAGDWNTRLRETLPLIVDMCCKYRGYKAESVQERRELFAGDLEVPKSV